MLLLDSRCTVLDGVSVFPDHVDPLQWYYLPTQPHLTVVDGTPMFQLIGFRGSRTGGLLSFDCNIGLDQPRVNALQQKIKSQFHLDGKPRLAPVTPVDGTVHLIIMGTDSSIPSSDNPALVIKAVHNAKPSLYNDNAASFSVLLDEGGYALVEGTLDAAILPIAVVYSLDYLALRPAYQVTLSIDWDRVQKHLDQAFGTKLWIFSSQISKVVDELDESKVIDIRADTFVPEDTEGVIERRDAALAQVKAMITSAFFEPSLPPWKPDNPSGWVQDLKAIGEFATQLAVMGAGAPTPSHIPVAFSYKKTDYTRIDKKHLDVNFAERTTVRRSIYPQGHLTSLFSVIAASPELKNRLVREVEDSEFLRKRKLNVIYRPNLGAPYIDSINVRASYGGITRNALLTPDTWTANFEWLSDLQGGVMRREVNLSYDVRFKDANTSERPGELSSGTETTTEDIVSLLPEQDVFTVRSVAVLAERIPWNRFDSVEVHTRYRDKDNKIDQRELFRLVETKPDVLWPMFVVDRSHMSYEVRTVMRAVDGNDVDSGWSISDKDEIQVRNPFRARTLHILPSVAWSEIREIFVNVRYEDKKNNVLVEDMLYLNQTTTPPPFVVDLRDPTQTAIEYTVTFSYVDGRVKQLPPSVTYESLIIVDPKKHGHRVVQILPPPEWKQRSVEKITLELQYEDLAERLGFAALIDLEDPDTPARFGYDYADATRNKYQWRSTVWFSNGLKHKTEKWMVSAEPVLVPSLP